MKISIVVPNLNQAAYLELTLESIFCNRISDLEVLVIDGGSTDESVSVIKKFESKISWWCSEADGGHYEAINKGFSHSTGEILGWLNSSDLYFPYTLATVERIFTRHDHVQWITSLAKTTISEGGILSTFQNVLGYSRGGLRRGLCGGFENWNFLQQETCFWRRSLWESVGSEIPNDYSLAGDFALWSKFFEKVPVYGVTGPLAAFRFHNSQRSSEDGYMLQVMQILAKLETAEEVAHERHFGIVFPEASDEERFDWATHLHLDDWVIYDDEVGYRLLEVFQNYHNMKCNLDEALRVMDVRQEYIDYLEKECAAKQQCIESLERGCRERLVALEAVSQQLELLKTNPLLRLSTRISSAIGRP